MQSDSDNFCVTFGRVSTFSFPFRQNGRYNGSMEALPQNYRVYKNGAIFDKDKGRIVALRPELAVKNTQITPEKSSDYLARRLEKKRARIEAGAMAAVAQRLPDTFTGDDGDWIEAVAQQVASKALDPLDPKQVDAARFLLQEAGLSEARQQQATPAQDIGDVLREMAAFARELRQMQGTHDTDTVTAAADEE